MSAAEELPAVLGGEPVRPSGPPGWPPPLPAVEAALRDCYLTGGWGRYHGPATQRLIAELESLFEVSQVILCSSGTAAIELALRGLAIEPGDEVLLSAYDFKGNFQDILAVGAIPVLLDVDLRTGQLDLDQIEAAMSPRVKAVIASHLHGGWVDLAQLRERLDAAGDAGRAVRIIEDACQMPGARFGSRRAGAGGDVSVLSFGGSKLLTAGRGGAILTNRAEIAARIRRHVQRGNEAYPLSELQAAVLIPQLGPLDTDRRSRAATVRMICAELSNDIRLRPVCPAIPSLAESSAASRDEDLAATTALKGTIEPDYYKLAWEYDPAGFDGLSRDAFAGALRAEGIAFWPGFRALHRTHARGRFRAVGPLSQADRMDTNWLVLHHPVLREGATAAAEIVRAIRKLRAWAGELKSVPGLTCQPEMLSEVGS